MKSDLSKHEDNTEGALNFCQSDNETVLRCIKDWDRHFNKDKYKAKDRVYLNWSEGHFKGHGVYMEQAMNF